MNNKYENGKIYKITDISYTLTYYGSTTEALCRRMVKHRAAYKAYKNEGKGKHVTAYKLFDEFGLENCKIELVELCPCASKMELERKEGEYIKNNDCVNKMIMERAIEEYHQEYRENNKAIIAQKSKEYRTLNVLLTCKKEWYAINAEHAREQKHQYYEDNKERIRARQKEPFICNLCGGRYQRNAKASHCRAMKHQNALNSATHEPEEELQPLDNSAYVSEREVGLLHPEENDDEKDKTHKYIITIE